MTRRPPPIEIEERSKARFSASQRHAILLRQSTDGFARCDACDEVIANLSPDGHWMVLRPVEYDHGHARALGGRTHVENGRALCGHPRDCHKQKTASDQARLHKAIRMSGGEGSQYHRRQMRKAKGERPMLSGRGFQK